MTAAGGHPGAPPKSAFTRVCDALEQAAPAAATQVYHRGRPHSRARLTVYPRRYYEPAPYFADYSYYYPAVRGFEDYNPVPRGNMRGCTVDLGYGRYESCDK